MKRFLLCIFLFYPVFCFSQTSDQLQRPVLDWAFFRNDKPADREHEAMVFYNINYKYTPSGGTKDSLLFKFDVTLQMDSVRSYFLSTKRFKNTQLLAHEQGHADIAYVYANRLKSEFYNTKYAIGTYKDQINMIFTKVYEDMKNENVLYDLETNHSRNAAEQVRWYKKIQDMIGIEISSPQAHLH